MKRWINRLMWNIAFYKWITKTMFRHVFGRSYVFRDTPLWVLTAITAEAPEEDDDETLHTYYKAACDEVTRRLEQTARTGQTLREES